MSLDSINKTVAKFWDEKYDCFNGFRFHTDYISADNRAWRITKYGGSTPDGTYIKKVIYNDPATIVFWSDGTKTVSKALDSDTYSREMGLLLCYMKKLVPNKNIHNLLNDWSGIDDSNHQTVYLKDVKKIQGKKEI